MTSPVGEARAPAPFWANPVARQWRCAGAPAQAWSFHRGLPGYAVSPLVELPGLAVDLGIGRVFLKDESQRLGLPAFKVLGASWAIARLLASLVAVPEPWTLPGLRTAAGGLGTTLVTATDGNHGRAVARVAGLLGLPAQVFVPQGIAEPYLAAISAEGAAVDVVDGCYDDAVARAAQFAAATPDAQLVQDTAWPGYEQVPGWIVEGYSTMLREADAQLDAAGVADPGLIVVPVGVGSLAQAVVTHCRSLPAGRHRRVLGVEPETAACVLHSLASGALRSVATPGTIMQGLNCGTPSSLAWPYLRHGLDAAVAVPDAAASRAVTALRSLGIASGPSGAASLAGARAALTGVGAGARRAALGIRSDSVLVLINSEGPTGAH